MNDRALVHGARAVVAVSALMAAAGLVLAAETGHLGAWWRAYGALSAVLAGSFGTFVWLAIGRQPRNVAVWSMLASCGLGLEAAGLALVGAFSGRTLDAMLEPGWVPAQAPFAVGWTLVVAEGAAVVGLFTPLTLGLLLFPDGRLDTPRSKVLAAVSAAAIIVLATAHGWWYRPGNDAAEGSVVNGSVFVLVLAVLGSVLDLGLRFRSSAGVTRQQFKWILWGTTVGALVFGAFALLPDSSATSELAPLVAMVAGLSWVASYGVAIGRYRLYDIDVILSRTVVYAALAAIVTGIYVVVVVGIGEVAGTSDAWLWVLTTVLVAVLFEPVRARLHRWASRIVYGREATPYEVLADLALRLALSETADELLARVTDRLRAGTGAQRTTAWLVEGDGLRLVAASAADSVADEPELAAPPQGSVVPITHDGRLMGQLALEAAPGGGIRPADVELAEDLAGSAALVLHKLRLDADLRAKVDEIDESRRRMLRAHDEELLRFERQLERTIEPPIRALEAGVHHARGIAVAEGAERTAAMLASFGGEARDAIDEIRSLAQGIYSPMLHGDGLIAAIPALAERTPLDVEVELDLQERHAPAVEGAVYFSVSEALTNAVKHAQGPVAVSVSDTDGQLVFEVRDSGPGFDAAATPVGSGLHNIADRLDAVGGELTVESRPGSATTLTGRIPLGAMVAAVPGGAKRVS